MTLGAGGGKLESVVESSKPAAVRGADLEGPGVAAVTAGAAEGLSRVDRFLEGHLVGRVAGATPLLGGVRHRAGDEADEPRGQSRQQVRTPVHATWAP